MLDDISSVAAAFALDVDRGVVTRARLAYGGVAPTPREPSEAEQALSARLSIAASSIWLVRLERYFTPLSDVRASAAYRQAMVVNLFERFTWECAAP